MKRKTAAQRLVELDSYSDSIPPNPLITMRETHDTGDLSQLEFSKYLGVSKSVVTQAENAAFQLIPVDYRAKIKNIMATNAAYQLHRREKRQFYFDANDFPDYPTSRKPMQALIEHFEMNLHEFGSKSCVTVAEIWKMNTTKPLVTTNFHEFLIQIGIDKKWIEQFNAGLRHNSSSPIKLPTS